MAKYKTALGKVVDMSALAAKNERVRAVGNMKVNARGDTIDAAGRVIQPVTSKVNEAYSKTVGNKSANVQRPRTQSRPQPNMQAQARAAQRGPANAQQVPTKSGVNARVDKEELSEIERDLEESMDDDIEVEQIKARETQKPSGKK